MHSRPNKNSKMDAKYLIRLVFNYFRASDTSKFDLRYFLKKFF